MLACRCPGDCLSRNRETETVSCVDLLNASRWTTEEICIIGYYLHFVFSPVKSSHVTPHILLQLQQLHLLIIHGAWKAKLSHSKLTKAH